MKQDRLETPALSLSAGVLDGYSQVYRSSIIKNLDGVEKIISSGTDYIDLSNIALSLVSTDVLDTNIAITITGLDLDYNLFSREYTLEGTTPISLENISRLFSIRNSTGEHGSVVTTAKSFVGSVKVFNGANDYLIANSTNQAAYNICFTIPKGFTGFLNFLDWQVTKSSGSTAAIAFRAYARNPNGVWYVVYESGLTVPNSSSQSFDLRGNPIQITEMTDVKFTAISTSQTVDVSASVIYYLIDNLTISSAD